MVSHIRKVFRQKKKQPNKKRSLIVFWCFCGRSPAGRSSQSVDASFYHFSLNVFTIFVSREHQQKTVNRSFLYRQQQAMHEAEHVENQLNPSLPKSESAGLEEGKKKHLHFQT